MTKQESLARLHKPHRRTIRLTKTLKLRYSGTVVINEQLTAVFE